MPVTSGRLIGVKAVQKHTTPHGMRIPVTLNVYGEKCIAGSRNHVRFLQGNDTPSETVGPLRLLSTIPCKSHHCHNLRETSNRNNIKAGEVEQSAACGVNKATTNARAAAVNMSYDLCSRAIYHEALRVQLPHWTGTTGRVSEALEDL